MTPIITGPANFDVLIVDSMGKPNHKVAENISRWIKIKLPGASVNCTSSKKKFSKRMKITAALSPYST